MEGLSDNKDFKYETVIFDLDGTLLDTIKDIEIGVNFALSKLGYAERTHEEIKTFIGHGSEVLVRKAMPRGSSDKEIQNCLKVFKDYYIKNMFENTEPYPGIVELLEDLKKAGIQIGVVSNKPDVATKKACENFFEGLILDAIGDNEYRNGKPAPDNLLEIMLDLGATIEDTCYIGDSDVDIRTAENTGIPCYSTMWGYGNKEEIENMNPENIILSPKDLKIALLR